MATDRSEYFAKYRRENKEKMAAYSKKWREENPEKIESYKDRARAYDRERAKRPERQAAQKKAHDEWYERSKYEQQANQKVLYAERRKKLEDLKSDLGCAACGITEGKVLQFHHRDRSQKKFTIGRSIVRYSWENIMLEVFKCDVLCGNCHVMLHAGLIEFEDV